MPPSSPFDHSSAAPGGSGDLELSHRRRRHALGVIAFVSLVLGAAVGSAAGHNENPPAAAAAPKKVVSLEARRQRGWVAHPGPVPILMYHGVDAATDPPLSGLQIPKREFRGQIRWLDDHGYQAVTMHEVERAWAGLGKLPRKPVVLTFDDGFHSFDKVALPELQKLGWPGVLYLAVNNLTWDRGITFDEAQRIVDAGWELGSHTINHTNLTAEDPRGLRHEVVDSKAILEATFGRKITTFCYPGGSNDPRVQKAVRRAGYHSATSVVNNIANSANLFDLSRIHIDPGTSGAELGAKLEKAASGDLTTPAVGEGPVR